MINHHKYLTHLTEEKILHFQNSKLPIYSFLLPKKETEEEIIKNIYMRVYWRIVILCVTDYVFCHLHRLPEQHDCIFDHKEHGRKEARDKMVSPKKHVGTSLKRLDSDTYWHAAAAGRPLLGGAGTTHASSGLAIVQRLKQRAIWTYPGHLQLKCADIVTIKFKACFYYRYA